MATEVSPATKELVDRMMMGRWHHHDHRCKRPLAIGPAPALLTSTRKA